MPTTYMAGADEKIGLSGEEGRGQGHSRSNGEWIDALRSGGNRRDAAIGDLRRLLIRGLRYGLYGGGERRERVDHIEDFVQDALLRILDNLDSFRGECRFTTWAQKVALRVAYSELRRKQWNDISLDQMLDIGDGRTTLMAVFPDAAPTPEDRTSGRMSMELVSGIIEKDLTDLQRQALQTVVISGVPMTEAARSMRTNPNALYKLLHDARKRVRLELERRGVGAEQLLAEFS